MKTIVLWLLYQQCEGIPWPVRTMWTWISTTQNQFWWKCMRYPAKLTDTSTISSIVATWKFRNLSAMDLSNHVWLRQPYLVKAIHVILAHRRRNQRRPRPDAVSVGTLWCHSIATPEWRHRTTVTGNCVKCIQRPTCRKLWTLSCWPLDRLLPITIRKFIAPAAYIRPFLSSRHRFVHLPRHWVTWHRFVIACPMHHRYSNIVKNRERHVSAF